MDYTVGDTIYFKFTTRAFATGIPTVLAGTPVLSAYEDASVTQITAGVSITADLDSVAGLNLATIVATGGNGFEAGKHYGIVITTGTVGGVSVVGEVIGQFTLSKSAAAVDLANGTDGLGALKAIIDTINTNAARLTAARAQIIDDWVNGGRLDLLLDLIPTTAMRGTDGALTDKAGFSLSAAGTLAIWHEALTNIVTASTIGKLLKDEITSARMATLTDWIDGGRLDLLLDGLMGATFNTATDSLEALRNRGDTAWVTGAGGSDRLLMVDTTIATLTSQTVFTLTAGSADNNAYINCTIVIEDVSTSTQKAVGIVGAYVGATKEVTLKYDPAIFTIATTDKVYILAENALKSTLANRQLNVAADGDIGGNVDGSVGSLVGHTGQSADHAAAIAAIPTTAMRGTDGALTDKAGFSLSTAGILAIWHQALTAVVTAGSVGKLLKDEITSVRMATLTDLIDGGRLDSILDTINTNAARLTAVRAAVLTDWIDGGRLDALLDLIPTTAMRGTDSAALASICTEARLAELAAANIPTDIDTLLTRLTAARAGALTDLIDGGRLDVLIDAIKAATDLIATTAATESYAADGATATLVQLNYMIWSFLNSLKFVTTTGTARKLDGSTAAMTFTLDDADNPTDINRAS